MKNIINNKSFWHIIIILIIFIIFGIFFNGLPNINFKSVDTSKIFSVQEITLNYSLYIGKQIIVNGKSQKCSKVQVNIHESDLYPCLMGVGENKQGYFLNLSKEYETLCSVNEKISDSMTMTGIKMGLNVTIKGILKKDSNGIYLKVIETDCGIPGKFISLTNTQDKNIKNIPKPAGHLIPLVDYTCESIFPEKVSIIHHADGTSSTYPDRVWATQNTQYTNGINLISTCYQQNFQGGNINIYDCESGFFIVQDTLPDGTIVNKKYHIMYKFTINKNDCTNDVCITKLSSCKIENFGPPSMMEPNYLKYVAQPVINPEGSSACKGCVAKDGTCIRPGSYYYGQYCEE